MRIGETDRSRHSPVALTIIASATIRRKRRRVRR